MLNRQGDSCGRHREAVAASLGVRWSNRKVGGAEVWWWLLSIQMGTGMWQRHWGQAWQKQLERMWLRETHELCPQGLSTGGLNWSMEGAFTPLLMSVASVVSISATP